MLYHCAYDVNMKIQDCFKIEVDLIGRAKAQAKKEGGNKSALYRKAIIEYLERNEKK